MKANDIDTHSADGKGVANLQEMLEMSIGIFVWLAAEWASLYHVDEGWLQLEATISDWRSWSDTYVLARWSGELTDRLGCHPRCSLVNDGKDWVRQKELLLRRYNTGSYFPQK